MPVRHPDYMGLDVYGLDFNLIATHGSRVLVFLVILQHEYSKLFRGVTLSKETNDPILFDFLTQRVQALDTALALCAEQDDMNP